MSLLLLTFALSFLVCVLLTPLVRDHARKRGILDVPDRERKLHAKETPLGGGFAVFISALMATAGVFLGARLITDEIPIQPFVIPLMFASLVILGVGLAFDVLKIRIRQKLLGQCVAIAILVASGIHFDEISVFGRDVSLGLLAIPLTAMWLLFAINSLNLLDGADGFASTIGIVICLTLAAMSWHMGNYTGMVIAASMAGALAGFLIFNFPPSSIFLGDSGSMLIGLIVGVLAMQSNVKSAATYALATPVALLAIPLFDSLAAIARRTLTGRPLAVGDRAHIHHAMMRRGFGPRRLVFGAVVLSIIPAAGAFFSIWLNDERYAWGSLVLLGMFLVGGRLFGFNELQLITNRSVAFIESLVYRTTGMSTSEKRVGLLDSEHCEQLWQQLTGFADEHKLTRVQFDLKGSWMDDGRDVLWEHTSRQHHGDNWQVSVPVFAKGRSFGRVQLTGGMEGNSGQHIMGPMGELLESIGPLVDQLVDDAASQGVAMQQGLAERILFINRSYWPDVEATGQLLTEMCEDLAEKGFAVSVLAGQPNHVTNQSETYHHRGVQRRNGVDIYRVQHTTFAKSSIIGKALNLISFTVAATWQSFSIPRHEIVVAESDPFLLAVLGSWIKRWRSSQLIVYVQDVYPDVAVETGKIGESSIITKIVKSAMRKAYKDADSIIALSDCMKRRLTQSGASKDKITIIPNWVDTDSIFPCKTNNAFRAQHSLENKFIVMHSGNMGFTQNLIQFLDVALALKEHEDLVFVLIGDGAMRQKLYAETQRRHLGNVLFFPYQPRERLHDTLSAADIHLVSMHPRISGCLVPSKTYGIAATGTPILAIVPSCTELSDTVIKYDLGTALAPGNATEIADAITKYYNNPSLVHAQGRRQRQYAVQNYSRAKSVQGFIDLLNTPPKRTTDTDHVPRRPSVVRA